MATLEMLLLTDRLRELRSLSKIAAERQSEVKKRM
jgi:hypothetical protein